MSISPSPRVPAAPRDPKILFLHIPKTAGMSLNGLFIRNYRGNPHFNIEMPNITEENWQACLERIRNIPQEKLDRYHIFKGHMIYGLHEVIPGPVEYITFLRDPVERLISHYKMACRYKAYPPGHKIDLSQRDWNLGQYYPLAHALDNFQTRALSGMDFQIPFGACGEEHLRLAKEHMDHHFKFVGLTEQFDLSLMLMRHVCGWGWRYYVPDNVAPYNEIQVSPDVIEAMRKLNRFDLELYRYAQERFNRMVDLYGWNLQAELQAYRLGNHLHQGLHLLRRTIKQKLKRKNPGSGKRVNAEPM